ncbi:hypothetical protein BD309DRAFT_1024796 [Dichomitus squalens]|uniref:Uncharacterized protein n=1 Tax=Dichomitus squalens TaxID=114155 RepID=A0A4Q9P8P3_9APHY|nr:hypothetical protein BD309DRAFT_1024796 [Dichomitus squalens]TBU50949.1 hypothetical protein BD310DRAFT_983134 [Dichomitus squalens]
MAGSTQTSITSSANIGNARDYIAVHIRGKERSRPQVTSTISPLSLYTLFNLALSPLLRRPPSPRPSPTTPVARPSDPVLQTYTVRFAHCRPSIRTPTIHLPPMQPEIANARRAPHPCTISLGCPALVTTVRTTRSSPDTVRNVRRQCGLPTQPWWPR